MEVNYILKNYIFLKSLYISFDSWQETSLFIKIEFRAIAQ